MTGFIQHSDRIRKFAGQDVLAGSSFSIIPDRTSALHVSGSDARDFLQRMSTNDLMVPKEGTVRRNLFLNETGRVIDYVWQIEEEGSFLLLSGFPEHTVLQEWLTKFIFIEDIRVEPRSMTGCAVIGKDAENYVRDNFGLPVNDTSENLCATTIPAGKAWIFRDRAFQSPLFRIVIDVGTSVGALHDHPIFPLLESHRGSNDLLEILRIEAGIPAIGKELDSKVNPLEANLRDDISFTKGCYVGQEVIARTETYGKQRKRLVGFSTGAREQEAHPQAEMFFNDTVVGRTTSRCFHPLAGRDIGLAYMNMHVVATEVIIRSPGESEVARIHELPFRL